MPITQVITAPPPAPSRSNDEVTFNALTDAELAYRKNVLVPQLNAFAEQANALAADVSSKQIVASSAAETAAAKAELTANNAITTAADRAQTGLDRAAVAAISATAGVASINGQHGVVVIKTINGASLLGSGNIEISTLSVAGNLSPYVTQSTTLTITNYDSATTYTLAATGGTVSRSTNTLTYTAGSTAGTFALTINGRSIPVTVQAAAIAAPGLTSPTSGETNIGQAPTITTGAFAYIGVSDTHVNTDWEIRTAANGGGTLMASSLADSTNKTSWAMPGSLLAVATTYYARARHRGTALGASAWSENAFTTAAAFTPTVPGTAYQGGFYAGRVVIGGNTYVVIVAPKASGHHTSKQWKTTNGTTSGTLSLNDGLTNSNAMNNASHPAAQFCRALTVGGYTDWYLPSRDELEVCYRNLKPTTTANIVFTPRTSTLGAGNGSDSQGNGDNDNSSPDGSAYATGSPAQTAASAFLTGAAEAFDSTHYWASSEFTASDGHLQSFLDGSQVYNAKNGNFCVRAVRKVLI